MNYTFHFYLKKNYTFAFSINKINLDTDCRSSQKVKYFNDHLKKAESWSERVSKSSITNRIQPKTLLLISFSLFEKKAGPFVF